MKQTSSYIDLFVSLLVIPVLAYIFPFSDWITGYPLFPILLVLQFVFSYFICRYIVVPFFFKREVLAYLVGIGVVALLILLMYGLTLNREGWPFHNLSEIYNPIDPGRLYMSRQREWLVFFVMLLMGFIAGVFAELELQRMRQYTIEHERDKAELALYRAQLNPHFLFNTLNALYGLVVTKSDCAEDAFMRFIELEKYMVGNAQKDKVMVEDEFHFLSNYVHLQQLRLNEMTHVEFFYQNDMHQAEIAPMLLIPFVENAFKYGTSAERPCQIHFSLLLSADGILQFKSENEIFMTNGITGTGTGIVNCRNRLELLYPNRHVLDIKEQDGKYYVCLTIHL